MYIVLDSNVFIADYRMNGTSFKDLFNYIKKTNSTMVLPRIVIDEVLRNFNKIADLKLDKIKNLDNDSNRYFGKQIFDYDNMKQRILEEKANYKIYLNSKLSENKCFIIEYKKSKFQEIMNRYILRKKPFSENGRGFGDCIIWHAVMDCVFDIGETAFITKDKDFYNEPELCLHSELKDEVKKAKNNLSWYKDLNSFLTDRSEKIKGIDLEWIKTQEIYEILPQKVQSHIDNNLVQFESFLSEFPYGQISGSNVQDMNMKPTSLYLYEDVEHKYVIRLMFEVDVELGYYFYNTLSLRPYDEISYHSDKLNAGILVSLNLQDDDLTFNKIDTMVISDDMAQRVP